MEEREELDMKILENVDMMLYVIEPETVAFPFVADYQSSDEPSVALLPTTFSVAEFTFKELGIATIKEWTERWYADRIGCAKKYREIAESQAAPSALIRYLQSFQ